MPNRDTAPSLGLRFARLALAFAPARCVLAAALAAAVTLAVAGCAPSASQVRRARASAYQTEFATVWNAVVAEVQGQYPVLAIEDPIKGVIKTDWRLIERAAKDEDIDEETQTSPLGRTMVVRGGKLMRLEVRISGGPPWSVEVEGEAARFRPGFTVATPYTRGAVDEPEWVQGRIDGMIVRIHERLARHAVPRPTRTVVVRRRVADPARWGNLPPAAASAIADAHAAAARKDVPALARHVAASFLHDGEELPGDQIVAIWSADPALVGDLARALEAGCGPGGAGLLVCPAAGGGAGPRATWRAEGDVWKLAEFGPPR